MRLVIEIDENVFTRLFDNGIQDNEIAVDDVCEMARALRLGKPFPEHHGRLIDEQQIIDRFKPIERFEYWRIGLDGLVNVLSDAPTIIEGSDSE